MTAVRFLARAILLLALLPAPLAAQAGRVEGRVYDRDSNRPVAGARVSAGGRETRTGSDGRYRLSLPAGERRVEARALGFVRAEADVAVAPGSTLTQDFALAASPVLLDAVVATGTVARTELRAVPNAVSVVGAEQIEARGITRTEELFRGELPGAFAQGDPLGGTSGELQLLLYARGSTNQAGPGSAPKVYIDHVEVSDPSALLTLDPRSIERVELVSGPQASTVYGAGALNGVLQIFLKKGSFRSPGPRVSLRASAGTVENSFDGRVVAQHDHGARLEGSAGGASYALGGSYLRTGEWIPGRTEDRVSLDGAVRLLLGDLTAELSARYGRLGAEGYSRPFEAREIRDGRFRFEIPSHLFGLPGTRALRQQTLGLSLAYAPAPGWQHRLTLGRDEAWGESVNRPLYAQLSDTLVSVGDDFASVLTASYSATWDVPLGGWLRPTLTAGADLTENRRVVTSASGRAATGAFPGSAASFTTRSDDPTRGAFAQAQVAVADAVFLTAGVRVEDNPNFGPDHGVAWAPRAGLSVARGVGPVEVKARAAYGRAVNAPPAGARDDVRSLDPVFGLPFVSQLGNPEVGPETQRGGEVGVDVAWGARATLQLTAFRQTADDLIGVVTRFVTDSAITTEFGGFFVFPQSRIVNLGKVRTTGWEGAATYAAGPWALRGTYAHAVSRVLELTDPANGFYRAGDVVAGPARRTGSLDARWSGRRARAGAHLSYTGPVRVLFNNALQAERFSGRLLPEQGRTWSADPYATGAYTASGYAQLDLTAGYRVREGADVFLKLFNATDVYRSDRDNLGIAQGRRVLAGVEVEL